MFKQGLAVQALMKTAKNNQRQGVQPIIRKVLPVTKSTISNRPAVKKFSPEPKTRHPDAAPQEANYPKTEIHFNPSLKDKKLLKYLLEMKFMTFEQIQTGFDLAKNEDIHLKSAFAAGFIKSMDPLLKPDSLIIPTLKAYELLKAENPGKDLAMPVKRVFAPAVNHDLKLVDLRMRFEDLGFIERWVSEKSMEEVPYMVRTFQSPLGESGGQGLPDAYCVKKNGKSYFLELEISKKTMKNYDTRISEYQKILDLKEMKDQGVEGVIFVCSDPAVTDILKEKTKDISNISVLPLARYLSKKELKPKSGPEQAEK